MNPSHHSTSCNTTKEAEKNGGSCQGETVIGCITQNADDGPRHVVSELHGKGEICGKDFCI